MWRVLIVGADGRRSAALRAGLREQGYGVVCAQTAAAGLRLLRGVDLAILSLERGDAAIDADAAVAMLAGRVPLMVLPNRGSLDGKDLVRTVERCVIGGVEVDFARYIATRDGESVELSPREIDLIRFLAERSDRVVSRDEILRGVWGARAMTVTRTVDVHVAKLRRKLGERAIRTVHGAGYRFGEAS
jgi:DNA-binding response OmpR family regulator